jgi:hypothetical protein
MEVTHKIRDDSCFLLPAARFAALAARGYNTNVCLDNAG